MQYQVDPTDQTPENDPKLLFCLSDHFLTISDPFLWLLSDPAWTGDVAKFREHLVLSQYAISSRYQKTKLKKMIKNFFFAIRIIQERIFWLLDDAAWPSNLFTW